MWDFIVQIIVRLQPSSKYEIIGTFWVGSSSKGKEVITNLRTVNFSYFENRTFEKSE
jgi:hypothetical protein